MTATAVAPLAAAAHDAQCRSCARSFLAIPAAYDRPLTEADITEEDALAND